MGIQKTQQAQRLYPTTCTFIIILYSQFKYVRYSNALNVSVAPTLPLMRRTAQMCVAAVHISS